MKSVQVELKDSTPATIFFLNNEDVKAIPEDIITQMREMYNDVIEEGKTYPYEDKALDNKQFEQIWLLKDFAIMLDGHNELLTPDSLALGTYYVKPNYPGRCSHVSNAGFLVSTNCRGKGIGKILGQSYIKWAPTLGYTYSVFNLVFATNVASWRAWESLGFTRIGVVPGAARLKGFDSLVDAYIYGKSLT